jgi:hypothetical protein
MTFEEALKEMRSGKLIARPHMRWHPRPPRAIGLLRTDKGYGEVVSVVEYIGDTITFSVSFSGSDILADDWSVV